MPIDSSAPQFKVLRDGAIELRALEPPDVEVTVRWRNDPEIRDQLLSFRFPVSHVMEAKFIERAIEGEGQSQCVGGIVDLSDGALCGLVYLRDIDWISRHAAFGMLIGQREKWGRGFGRRALRLMLHHAFNVLNLERVYLYVAEYNHRAIKLYKAAGFIHEGVLRRQIALDGRYHGLLVMGLLREEFTAHMSAIDDARP